MSSIEINNSQNVNLTFHLASVGDRILAYALDMVIKISYLLVLWLLFIKIGKIDFFLSSLDQWSLLAVFGIILLPVNLYTLVFESLTEGQTPGKRIMKIKVVKTDGYQASFGDYLIRWIFRLVDILISTGIIGVLTIIFNKESKRLGDIAAGTAVITLKNNYTIDHTILVDLARDYVPTYPQVIALSDNDIRIITEAFQKAQEKADYEIITRLVDKIKNSTGIIVQNDTLNDVQFIQTVIKDYNFYTGKEVWV